MSKSAAFLLLGPEEGQKREYKEKIKKALLKTNDPSQLETHRFYGMEFSLQSFLSLMKSGALFSSQKYVEIVQSENLKKSDIKEIASLCEKMPAATVLVIESPQISLGKELDKVIAKDKKKIFWELFENQKMGWVQHYFQEAGLTIEREAALLLLELIENNTHDLRQECEKLVLFFGPKAHIQAEDIEGYIYHSKEENVFSLFSKIITLDLTSSLETAGKILLSGSAEAVQLIGGLFWQFKRLHGFLKCIEERYSAAEAYKVCNIRGKRNQKEHLEASKNFTHHEVENVIELLSQYDMLFRSVRTDYQAILFDLLLYGIVMKKGSTTIGMNTNFTV